jgi:hypothetical protein
MKHHIPHEVVILSGGHPPAHVPHTERGPCASSEHDRNVSGAWYHGLPADIGPNDVEIR